MSFTHSVTVRSNHTVRKIRDVRAATAAATWLAGKAVLAEAQRRVRRGKTLELLDSLQILGKEGDESIRVGSVAAAAHGGRPVARFIENGTVKMHAAPFMRPGAAMGRKTLKLEAEARIRAALEAL